MLKAYIDDSGSDHGSEHFVLGGLVAPSYTWGYIEHLWEEALEKWGIPYFKMSEAHSLEGCFGGWSKGRRNECVGHFLGVITGGVKKVGIPVAGAAVVSRSDYREALEHMRVEHRVEVQMRDDTLYPLLMHLVVQRMRLATDAMKEGVGVTGRLVCIFDVQHSVGASIKWSKPHLLDLDNVSVVTHVSSQDFLALQAADMWAWAVRRKFEFPGNPTRIYKKLIMSLDSEQYMISRLSLEDLISAFESLLGGGGEADVD